MERSDLKSVYQIPSFARKEAYSFEATAETFDIYQELSQIGEEIEKCRSFSARTA
ncbi:hypothetical protein IKF27_02300 [Candidatus Saccharibacteria bacterium]|nr:hypothetical protein [Candidatus Saccharibacteria bacterium]MCR5699926.1 hypothetical protein [Candidatus Saccharibacteria bacterium]